MIPTLIAFAAGAAVASAILAAGIKINQRRATARLVAQRIDRLTKGRL